MRKARCASILALALALTLVQSLAANAGSGGASVSQPDGLLGAVVPLIPWPKKIEVQIKNLLASNGELKVYCKDQDEVGEQELSYDSTFAFTVTQSVPEAMRGNTVFSCQLKWNDQTHNFDLYKQDRDFSTCGTKCEWEIKDNGPCLVSPSRCYPWP